jgi:hypothetical protein
MVDRRTRSQKEQDKQISQPIQLLMFSQRDIAIHLPLQNKSSLSDSKQHSGNILLGLPHLEMSRL